jgi:hypothetical protein
MDVPRSKKDVPCDGTFLYHLYPLVLMWEGIKEKGMISLVSL